MAKKRKPPRMQWIKCEGDIWCSLEHLDLSKVEETGVYIIWVSGRGAIGSHVVRVGQGKVSARLSEHRNDTNITRYSADGGTLYVTWASLSRIHRDGVERFLFDELEPIEGVRAPDVNPIQVNLPW